MRKVTGAAGLALGFLVLANLQVLAHGDVTPHPVDTTGLLSLGKDWGANSYRGDAKAVAAGAVGYLHNCAGCHGLNAEAGGVAPDLLAVAKDCVDMPGQNKADCFKDSDEYFKGVTLEGKKTSDGRYTMPGYAGVFTQEAVWAVKAYLDQRTEEEAKKK